LIDAITEAKRAEGCSNATVNRTLALIRAILRKCARDWEWLDRAPAVRLLKEPTRRIRFLSRHHGFEKGPTWRQLKRRMINMVHLKGRSAIVTGSNVCSFVWFADLMS
jgi:hypothetical protein